MAIWGLAFVAQRVGMRHVEPFTFNAVRFTLGALVLLPLVAYMRRRAAGPGAVGADLTLYYQGTSWEYVQFLNNAVSNTPTGAGAPNADEVAGFLEARADAEAR